MPETRDRAPLAWRIAVELLAWYSAAGLFIAAYVALTGGRPDGALPHLRLVTEAVLALAAARVALSALLPARLARVASTVLAISAFATLVTYYVVEIVALRSWGRVLTWDLLVFHGRGT